MSTTDERLAVQAKMQVENLETENANEHGRLEKLIVEGFRAVDVKVSKLAARVGIGGILVGLATVGLPVWGTLQASQSQAVVREQSAETTRQEFLKLQENWKLQYRNECRTRDADLAYVADLAAQRALTLEVIKGAPSAH